jgi:geranylgeranyl transferase type-1 subunit beta
MTAKHFSESEKASDIHRISMNISSRCPQPIQELEHTDYDTPHIIMTYTALLSLAILRDDFSKLDREGLLQFLRACQREDGR